MKIYKGLILFLTLGLIGGTVFALSWLRSNKRFGRPGIRAEAIPGSMNMNFDLPEKVLDYVSTNVPQSEVVLGYLPKDTSYAQRLYQAPDGFQVVANIILQGADRSSIHKPDYCMAGLGFNVVERSVVNIPIAGPQPYQLPVSRWVGVRTVKNPDGQAVEERCLYVFWFVADNEQTPSYDQHSSWLKKDLLTKGILQRWAYISYQTGCRPGEEDARFDRIKQLIAASVPEFELPPKSAGLSTTARTESEIVRNPGP